MKQFENEKMYPHENFFPGEYLPSLLLYGQSCVIAPFIISFITYNSYHVFQLQY